MIMSLSLLYIGVVRIIRFVVCSSDIVWKQRKSQAADGRPVLDNIVTKIEAEF